MKGGSNYMGNSKYGYMSKNVEFFNGIEWKSLADYKEGDKVLQYMKEGTSFLVDPMEFGSVKNEKAEMLYNWVVDFCGGFTENYGLVVKNFSTNTLSCVKASELETLAITDRDYLSSHGALNSTMMFDMGESTDGDISEFKKIEIKNIAYDYLVSRVKVPESVLSWKLEERRALLLALGIDIKFLMENDELESGIHFYNEEDEFLICSLISLSFIDVDVDYATTSMNDESMYSVTNNTPFSSNNSIKRMFVEDLYYLVVPTHMFVARIQGKVVIMGDSVVENI